MKDRAGTKRWSLATALAAVLGAGAFVVCGAASARPAAIEQAECGGPGKPACPLQAWMRANVGAPLASNDAEALSAGLAKAAKLSPDAGWSSWASFAAEGSAAAKKGDLAGARASCKGCHDKWREDYRARYRLRPIPR
jgi:hypothetical protein